MEQNRRTSVSGIPTRASAIPRPSSAAGGGAGDASAIPRPASRASGIPQPGVSRPGSSSGIPAKGPLGNYHRPASRVSAVGAAPSAPEDAPLVGATPAASRLRYSGVGVPSSAAGSAIQRQVSQSAAPERRTYTGAASRIGTAGGPSLGNSLGLSGAANSLGGKRTVSAAGLTSDEVDQNGSASKRPATRRLSADGTSPLLLTADLPHPALTPRPESPSYELSILRANYDQQLLSEERRYKKLEEDYEAKCRELDRYNNQRVELLAEWDRVQETQKEKEEEWSTTRRKLEQELHSLRGQNAELRTEADESRAQKSATEMELRGKTTALESQLAHLRAEVEMTKAEATRWKEEYGAARAEVEDLENAVEDEKRLRLEERDSARLGGEEGKKISEELSRQTSHMRKLEAEHAHLVAENGRLQHHASNVELLKEEKRSLEAKVRVLDELRTKLAESEASIRDLERDRIEWQDLLQNSLQAAIDEGSAAAASSVATADLDAPLPSVETPATFDRITLPQYLRSLRGALSGMEARIASLYASLEKTRARNAELEDEANDADAKQRKVEGEFAGLRASVARAERTEARLQDEIGRLKTMLETYETEERNHAASYDAANAQRIKILEGEAEQLRADKRSLTEDLEAVRREISAMTQTKQDAEAAAAAAAAASETGADIDALRSTMSAMTDKVQALERQLADSQAAFAQLEKEAQALVEENEKLYLRVGRGEFDQTREKCLVLIDNPVSRDLDLRKSTLDSLKRENEGLLKRVEEVSAALAAAGASGGAGVEGSGSEGALVPKEVVDNLKLDIVGLQESIKAKDKAMLRLKQVFSAKANEFREAIQSLFGYKVKFLENGKVKVTSTFSRSSRSTSLVFKSDEGNVGEMKLQGEAVEVSGLANLESLREYWLDTNGVRQSVPCFLAALNLELYESCTMAIRRTRGAQAMDDDEE